MEGKIRRRTKASELLELLDSCGFQNDGSNSRKSSQLMFAAVRKTNKKTAGKLPVATP